MSVTINGAGKVHVGANPTSAVTLVTEFSERAGAADSPLYVAAGALSSSDDYQTRPLTIDGTLGGAQTLQLDGDPTPAAVYLAVPADTVWYLYEITLTVADSGSWAYNTIGSRTALSSGLSIDITAADGTTQDMVIATALVDNLTLGNAATDIEQHVSALGYCAFRFRLAARLGGPIKMAAGQRVRVRVHDDLSAWAGNDIRAAAVYRTGEA